MCDQTLFVFNQIIATGHQYLYIERLRYIIIRSEHQTFYNIFHRSLCSQQNDRNMRKFHIGFDFIAQILSRHLGHDHITHDQVRLYLLCHLQSFASIARSIYVVHRQEYIFQHRQQFCIIIYQKNRRLIFFIYIFLRFDFLYFFRH